jgi:predicted  nucleic acid-binding Zn-ribbon protein
MQRAIFIFGGDFTLKEQLAKLIELQKIDLAQEALRLDVEKRREKVEADTELLQELEQTLEKQTESFSETQKLIENKRGELEEAQKSLGHANTKLNAVTNSRDYAALEHEVENFKKMITQIEGEIEQLSSALESAEAVIAKQRGEYDTLRDEIEKSRKEVDDAAAAIEDRVAELKSQADAVAKDINPQYLGRYRFIRSKRPGVAVVSASGGTCTGCHMRLQPQAYIQLQRQNSLECCQNCQRIIYYDAEEAAVLHNSGSSK